MNENYSEKELLMVKQLSEHWANLILTKTPICNNPPVVFNWVASECFLEEKTGPAVDSLRRVIKALNSGMYRMTEEYEELIIL